MHDKMHRCAEIHNAMLELTGNPNKTSEQHCDLGVARETRGVKDLQIIHGCFTENYPFPEKPSWYLSLQVLLLQKILISTVIKPVKLGPKFIPR